jgi:hypothetical protein
MKWAIRFGQQRVLPHSRTGSAGTMYVGESGHTLPHTRTLPQLADSDVLDNALHVRARSDGADVTANDVGRVSVIKSGAARFGWVACVDVVCVCACACACAWAELRATDVQIAISQLLATTRTPHVASGSRWPPEGTVQCHQPIATHNVTSPTRFTTSPHIECSGSQLAAPPLHCTERRASPTTCKTNNATGSEAVERTARSGRIPLCSRLPPWLRNSVGGGLCARQEGPLSATCD